MRLLITGAKGFVGKNLIAQLHNIKDGKAKKDGLTSELTLYEYDMDTNPELLDLYTKDCDFVFHLAGVNRPKDENEFMEGNFGFTSALLQSLKKNGNKGRLHVVVTNKGRLPSFMTNLNIEDVSRSFYANDNFFWLAPGETKSIEIDFELRERQVASSMKLVLNSWNAKTQSRMVKLVD